MILQQFDGTTHSLPVFGEYVSGETIMIGISIGPDMTESDPWNRFWVCVYVFKASAVYECVWGLSIGSNFDDYPKDDKAEFYVG